MVTLTRQTPTVREFRELTASPSTAQISGANNRYTPSDRVIQTVHLARAFTSQSPAVDLAFHLTSKLRPPDPSFDPGALWSWCLTCLGEQSEQKEHCNQEGEDHQTQHDTL